MLSRTLTCIICPNGCTIETQSENGKILSIAGYKCKRGAEYAATELTDPRRTISSSVRIDGAVLPLCSVRLTKPVPQKDIFRVIEAINNTHLNAPVHIGQVVIHNVCGLGSDVIVTKNLEIEKG